MEYNIKFSIFAKNYSLEKLPIKIILLLWLLFFASCVSKKDIVYLQYDEVDTAKVNNDYQLRFKPDDLLQITISSDDLLSVQPFNLPVVTYSTMTNKF